MEFGYLEIIANRINECDEQGLHLSLMASFYTALSALRIKNADCGVPTYAHTLLIEDATSIRTFNRERTQNHKALKKAADKHEAVRIIQSTLKNNPGEKVLLHATKQLLHDHGIRLDISEFDSYIDDLIASSESESEATEEEEEKKAKVKDKKKTILQRNTDDQYLANVESLLQTTKNIPVFITLIQRELDIQLGQLQTTINDTKAKIGDELNSIRTQLRNTNGPIVPEFCCGRIRSRHPFPACFKAAFCFYKQIFFLETMRSLYTLTHTWKFNWGIATAKTNNIKNALQLAYAKLFQLVPDERLVTHSQLPESAVKEYCIKIEHQTLFCIAIAITTQYTPITSTNWNKFTADQNLINAMMDINRLWAQTLATLYDVNTALKFIQENKRGTINPQDRTFRVGMPTLILLEAEQQLKDVHHKLAAARQNHYTILFFEDKFTPHENLVELLLHLASFAIYVSAGPRHRLEHNDEFFIDKDQWDTYCTHRIKKHTLAIKTLLESTLFNNIDVTNPHATSTNTIAWCASHAATCIASEHEEYKERDIPPASLNDAISIHNPDRKALCQRITEKNGIRLPLRKKHVETAIANLAYLV